MGHETPGSACRVSIIAGMTAGRPRPPRVAVIGAGFGGIAAAHALRRAGLDDFTIFESSPALGGTWHDNRYPGAEVDTPSHLYCFSFRFHDWSRSHPGQEEIRTYLEETVDSLSLRSHIRFNANVVAVRWSERDGCYAVSLSDGGIMPFEAVIACVGFLNVPLIPAWVDRAEFPGVVVHTAQWPADLSLTGRTVAIVGTGSSAVQVAAEAAKTAAALTIFQREPNWVLPKASRAFTDTERARWRSPWRFRLKRFSLYCQHEKYRIFGKPEQPGSKANVLFQRIAEKHLRDGLEGRPDLLAKLTPTFSFFGKRPIINDQYYATLRLPNVVLAPGVKSIDGAGVTDLTGRVHLPDIVVLATGFHANRYLSRLEVKGRKGADLHLTWAGEPAAYLGSCVPGFPNFFMLYGPNSSGCPAISMLECQARFAAANIAELGKRGARRVEVTRRAYDRFNGWLQARLDTSAFKTTTNYFTCASGRVVTQWPFSTTRFWWIATVMRRWVMRFER